MRLESGRLLDADVVVALPELVGPRIAGLPHDNHGYLPVDDHGRVVGCRDVYAAGDAPAFPIKHGGLAAQQADAVAEAIGAQVGAVGLPEPFRPIVRAQLLTGDAPLYIRVELGGPAEGVASTEPLWSPPGKVAGRYLAAYLAGGHAGPPRGPRVSPRRTARQSLIVQVACVHGGRGFDQGDGLDGRLPLRSVPP